MLRYIASITKVFSSNSDLSSRKSGLRSAFNYESMEQRRVLAGISFDIGTGFITIEGAMGDDAAVVSRPNATDLEVALTGFAPQTFTASLVSRIYFFGFEGNDYFANNTNLPSVADGGLGNDLLLGGSGVDEHYGGEGNDQLLGNDGDDILDGGDGDDRILVEGGNNIAYGRVGNDQIFSGAGNNQLFGGDGNDELYGGVLDDQIWGEGGDDLINTSEGNNFVDGGDGNDRIYSSSATSNILLGGNGNDIIFSGNAKSRIEGGAGDDILNGGNGIDTIFGQDGNDTIRGGLLNDYLEGGAGIDMLYGDDGDDEIKGGDGNDRLIGGNGHDRMLGDEGIDEIFGNEGNDEIYGGNGDDTIFGGNGNETIRAGAGNDKAYGQGGNDEIFGQDGNDLLTGGEGDDILHGQEGNDTLIGENGNDRLYGYNGNDVLNGGHGNDGLFGGINGTKTVVDQSGKNRFLVAETATNNLFGFKSSDAKLVFRNGLKTWSNVEIRVVDEALHDIHMRAGNTRMLNPTLTDRPVVFVKEFTLASSRYGSNELVTTMRQVINPVTGRAELQTFQEHQIRLPEWNEFDSASNLNVRAEVYREIAYNWASDAAMTAAYAPLSGIFPRFSNLNGWTNTQPAVSVISDYYKSQDNLWWYFRIGRFTESYATFNPAADFATSFKYYFDSRVNPADRIFHLEKMEIIDELFAKLAPF